MTGPMSFSTTAPMAVGCAAAISMVIRPPREVPMTAASCSPARDMKSSTSSSSLRLSDSDPDWPNYAPTIETLDVLDFMTLTGLHDAAVIGTSRGGLITMLMAAAQPTAIGAVVLNDIGPVIEHEGLARISGYVGRVPLPISWPDAARMVRELNRRHFPEVSDAVWEGVARQLYNEKNGKPAPGYDPNLGNALSVLDGPMPMLWPQFEALKRV